MGLITNVETAVDGLLVNYVSTYSAAFCSAIAPLAATGVTVYLILMGWAVSRGETNDPLHSVLVKFAKIAFVGGIALSAGEYQATVVDGINGLQVAIANVFNAASLGAAIDNALLPFETLGAALWSESVTGPLPNLALVAAAGLVSISEAVIVVVALGMYLLIKVGMALILALGPLFIFCAMFPATQRFAEGWLNQALHYAVSSGILAGLITMLYSIAQQFAGHVYANIGSTNIVNDTVALAGLTMALSVAVLNTKTFASQLTGGAAMQGIGGWLLNQAVGPKKQGKSKEDDKKPPAPENEVKQGKGDNQRDSYDNTQGNNGGGRGANNNSNSGNVPLYQRHVLSNILRGGRR